MLMELTNQQKEALWKDIAELTNELENGDWQHLYKYLTEAGVDTHKLFYYCQGEFTEIGLVLGKDGEIYYFDYSAEYNEESPDEEVEDKFEVQKVSLTEQSKDKKMYARSLVALEMAAAE